MSGVDSSGADVVDDPFEEFNRAMGADGDSVALPRLHRRPGRWPRARLGHRPEAGRRRGRRRSSPPTATRRSTPMLGDGETFSSAGYGEVMGVVMGRSILEMDEPEHHTYRSILQQAFTRKEMAALGDRAGRARWSTDGRRASSTTATPTWSASCSSRSRWRRDRRAARACRPRTCPSSTAWPSSSSASPSTGTARWRRRPSCASTSPSIVADRRLPPGRRHDLGAGRGRAGRPAPDRRGDLRLPAAAAAGRGRDHLPVVVEPAVRAADPPAPSSRRCWPTAA